MRFRTRLLLIFALTITGAVALVTGAVSVLTRRAFERMDQERRQALLDQFQRRLDEQGAGVVRRVQRVAESPELLRMAVEAGRSEPDFGPFVNEAQTLAEAASLDFLDIFETGGSIISSAHWPARFGYPNDWGALPEDRNTEKAFLTVVPMPEGSALALAAVRASRAGDKTVVLAGGTRLDSAFLQSLGLAPGMRALLWLGDGEVLDAKGPAETGGKLDELIARARQSHQRESGVVQWTADRLSTEAVLILPLERRGRMLGALAVATSLREQVWLERWILGAGLLTAAAGIALGLLVGWWATERVTRPVEQLAGGARAVAAGNWETHVEVSSQDEIGELAAAFNRMTQQLLEQRERAIQAERVAAWRELARRLAHELKNPLFPLQITVENMRKARQEAPPEFEEIFQEGTQMLLGELANLRAIVGQFSDFARMPPPELQEVGVNQAVQNVIKLFEAQWKSKERPAIEVVTELHADLPLIQADPEQLGRALRNLVLNALDAMPQGGRLTLRTRPSEAGVRIEISDTGQGLTGEECSRLFTPYYTTKQHGTGLGLAIVQSVVSDHKGRIWVESKPGAGATFVLDLPAKGESA